MRIPGDGETVFPDVERAADLRGHGRLDHAAMPPHSVRRAQHEEAFG